MHDYSGLFAAQAQPKGRGSHPGQDYSMPVFGASSLLDSPWLDAMLHPSTCQQSQVVPDALELDLAGIHAAAAAAGSASSPSREWSAEEFGDLLQQQQPSCSAHDPLSSFDGADSLAATAALLGSQEEAPFFAEGLLPASSPVGCHQQQQQQQVPDMPPQWVPTAMQQQQEEAVPAQTPSPSPAPAAAGFVWPCPEELRQLDSSTLAAATAFAAVFPATPAVTASAPFTTSRRASASMPHSQAALTAAADSAGSGTAPAAVAAARPKPRAAAKARAGTGSRVQQLLGPAVRTRAEAVARYKAKRARRGSVSRVRYQRRKDYADQRPRVGGRFVKVKGLQPQQPQSQQQAQPQLAQ